MKKQSDDKEIIELDLFQKIPFDETTKKDLIKIIQIIKKYQLSDCLNKETIDLVFKVLDINEDNIDNESLTHFPITFAQLFLPYPLLKDFINNEYSFMHLEMVLNWIMMNFDDYDYFVLEKYNVEFKEIVLKLKEISDKYIFSDLGKYNDIYTNKIITTVLAYLATILYVNIRDYEYQYDLLEKVFIKILTNYEDFLYDSNFYKRFQEEQDTKIIMNDFMYCKSLLDREICPPIKYVKGNVYE